MLCITLLDFNFSLRFMIRQQLLVWLLLFLVVVFVLWIFVTFFFRNTHAMYVPSFNRHINLMKKYLKLIPWKTLVDLWCGDGKAMRFFWKNFGVHCDGYEIQYFPYVYGKILNKIFWYPNLTLLKKDFLLADIHGYDYIYVYLLPEQMAAIEDRIFKHMKKDAIIVSNSFHFSVHKPYNIIKDTKGKPSVFLYKK